MERAVTRLPVSGLARWRWQIHKSTFWNGFVAGREVAQIVTLRAGLNVLVFKALNEFGDWKGSSCACAIARSCRLSHGLLSQFRLWAGNAQTRRSSDLSGPDRIHKPVKKRQLCLLHPASCLAQSEESHAIHFRVTSPNSRTRGPLHLVEIALVDVSRRAISSKSPTMHGLPAPLPDRSQRQVLAARLDPRLFLEFAESCGKQRFSRSHFSLGNCPMPMVLVFEKGPAWMSEVHLKHPVT